MALRTPLRKGIISIYPTIMEAWNTAKSANVKVIEDLISGEIVHSQSRPSVLMNFIIVVNFFKCFLAFHVVTTHCVLT